MARSVVISDPDWAALETAAQASNRSVGEQIAHWLKLGRAADQGASLGDAAQPDELGDLLQVSMNLAIDPKIKQGYAEIGQHAGAVGDDAHGHLVERQTDGTLRVLP